MKNFKRTKCIIALILSLASLVPITGRAQTSDQKTNAIIVTGQVKKELKFTLEDIEQYPSKPLGDVVITSHSGEPRAIAKQLEGVLLKDLLKDLELKEDSPKRFSEFYLIFVASDNYKVVYSWNEIFNSPTGDNVFVVTAKEGKKLREMDERILTITPTDLRTGRRHIRWLSKIVVERVK